MAVTNNIHFSPATDLNRPFNVWDMKYILFILSISLACISCMPDKADNAIAKLSWLPGSWQSITEEVQYYENWTKTNDSLYTGYGYMMSEGDTVFFESIKIQKQGKDIFYNVSTNEQDSLDVVSFKLVQDSAGIFIFENPAHDFPQRIGYSNPSMDSLHAYIEGNYKGQYRKEEFPMTRKN